MKPHPNNSGAKMTNKIENVETITHGLEPIALIIRANYDESGIHFFTPDSFSHQKMKGA